MISGSNRYQWVSTLLISLSAALLCNETLIILLNITADYFFDAFVFILTWIAYGPLNIIKASNFTRVTVSVSLLIFSILLFRLNTGCYIITGAIVWLAFFYFRPAVRKIYFLKTIVLALVWSLTTVALPVKYAGESMFSITSVLIIMRRFFFIAALTVPFEIRDRQRDIAAGYHSFVNIIGSGNSKIMGIILLLIFMILAFIQNQLHTLGLNIMLAMFLSAALSALIILIYNDKGSHSSKVLFFADGMLLVQFVLIMAARGL